jgi:predicted secreted protein
MCKKIPSFGRPSSVWIHRAGKHETCWAGCEGDRVKKWKKKMEEIINKRNKNKRKKIRKMEKRAARYAVMETNEKDCTSSANKYTTGLVDI